MFDNNVTTFSGHINTDLVDWREKLGKKLLKMLHLMIMIVMKAKIQRSFLMMRIMIQIVQNLQHHRHYNI